MTSPTPGDAKHEQHLSRDEFAALFRRLKGTANRGAADRSGALSFLTAAHVIAAAQEVRLGRSVSLARPIATEPAADDPEPARYEMTGALGGHHLERGLDFATDRFAMNIHGDASSHIDALCHVVFDSKLYNDVPVDDLTPRGATSLSIDVIQNGIVGRGVLLDIPRLRGQPWLEPGDVVTEGDLRAAEEAQPVHVGQGDLLFVRVGHSRRRNQLGPWDVAHARAGLHPTALEFVAEREIAALGSDGNNDAAPSRAEGVDFPVHVLAVNALGIYLLDYLQFEDLAEVCEQQNRWTFLAVIAPLRLPAATGSPINPIAVL
jgi:kynurenine formamidase